jgi:hypothetical protein
MQSIPTYSLFGNYLADVKKSVQEITPVDLAKKMDQKKDTVHLIDVRYVRMIYHVWAIDSFRTQVN